MVVTKKVTVPDAIFIKLIYDYLIRENVALVPYHESKATMNRNDNGWELTWQEGKND